ncbi:MAG: polyamine aminopropyltransferase [bacterium]|nr:polyamine aminopropyltransferase [bacterium]
MVALSEAKWWNEYDFQVQIRLGLKMRLLHAETTPYQQLDVYEHDLLGRVLVLDNIIQTTQGDEFIYHEMLTHVPLLGQAFTPKSDVSVLIIGGGDGGILREVLRHDWVTRVVMVELDEAVIHIAVKYLGINGDYDDPRVQLLIDDGSAYVRSEGQAQPFDTIIIDGPDPIGPGEALFTRDFFRDVRACLAPSGVMVRQIGVPIYQQDVFRLGVERVRESFGTVDVYRAAIATYMGGDMAFVMSSKDGHTCKQSRLDFSGRYYNHAVHAAAFALPTWWQETIAAA